jgi:hypothetical protein
MAHDKENKHKHKDDDDDDDPDLPSPWKEIQAAIWLGGLALLFWQGWWWPGILVLSAISGLTQALMWAYVRRKQKQEDVLQQARLAAASLPSNCPQCGAGIDAATVTWSGPASAVCPFCGSGLRGEPLPR